MFYFFVTQIVPLIGMKQPIAITLFVLLSVIIVSHADTYRSSKHKVQKYKSGNDPIIVELGKKREGGEAGEKGALEKVVGGNSGGPKECGRD